MAEATFGLLSAAYDLLYRDKDYATESARVLDLLERWGGARPRTILELGAGTGGHGVHLAAAGVEVQGVEASGDMVAKARVAQGLTIVHGDARTVRLDRTFDAVVSLFHVASYQTEDADLAAFLATAGAHLSPGGLVLFDAWYSPAVLAQRPEVRIRRVSGEGLTVLRIAEPKEEVSASRVDVHYTFAVDRESDGSREQGTELHRMRHVTVNEVRLLAARAGLEFIHAEGFPDGAPPSRDTWGVCFILRKVGE
jgi:SAM-dependent methyltransferase